jgi:hypothetical protein
MTGKPPLNLCLDSEDTIIHSAFSPRLDNLLRVDL